MPMRNMSKTDSGCGASCAATSPETIAAGVGRDGSYVVTDAPRATGRRSMGTIVQQPPGALPVVAVVPPDLRRCLLRRWCSRRRRPRPPARSPHASLRLGVVDLEARPCPPDPPAPSTPAAPGRWGVAWRVVSKPGQALPPPTGTAARPRGGLREVPPWHVLSNFARNSPEGVSGFEIRSLIFRGFRAVDEWGPGGITCDFGVGRVRLGKCLGSGWGSVWGAPVSIWGADGSEVLFFRRRD